jgi:hypothetical protein
MTGRGRRGAAPAVSVRPVTASVAGLLGASLGVLGWLTAQAATFGVAEHTHLTAHGLSLHRHDYAAPLAAGASAVGLLAVLVLLAVHLTATPSHTASSAHAAPRGSGRSEVRIGRLAPAVAALLFVAVETVEFVGSGAPAELMSGILAIGAGFQWLVARVACALTDAIVRRIEAVTVLPSRGTCSPASTPSAVITFAAGVAASTRARDWDGRAPPTHMPILVPVS